MKLNLSLIIILFCGLALQGSAFDFSWQIDETPEGSESATVVEPVQVILLDTVIDVPSHSASLALMRKYSVHLGPEWSQAHAYRLLQTFESIPQRINSPYSNNPRIGASVWILSNRHIQDDIMVEHHGEQKVVMIAEEAFVHATPLLAEIDGMRGKYFSKRLHRAVVRFVTNDGVDRRALERILEERYDVSLRVPDYAELTRHTTGEHAGRFQEFKNEELIAIASMFEEYPEGMHITSGLKYLVRRLDGTPHPTHPGAPAVAWTGSGYIEFMESAFQEQGLDFIHRLILHEKAHFLWAYLFDAQLKQDWIELGGWYENPNDKDGWSTTKQVEFVSAYAHTKDPNEDMAESISFYIVNPDKLRSRSPAKYEFIQNRIMHGTRYISKIREDLTFEVYNLYPDYVYPGRIVRVDIQVTGEPEEDKQVTVEIELHQESDLDAANTAYIRIFSDKDTYFDIAWMYPVDDDGMRVGSGHILRGHATLSPYAAEGYWAPDQIRIWDSNGNERLESQTDYGWKLYIDNPLADCEPPKYVPNSLRLSLADATTHKGEPYQILTATWQLIEKNGVSGVYARVDDANSETYSRSTEEWGEYDPETGIATVELDVPDYFPSGTYKVRYISMKDIALNLGRVYFTDRGSVLGDEPPVTIEIQTPNPDTTPPVLDLDRISIKAVPTNPVAPNGETQVDVTFRVKDNISGYSRTDMLLRDPQGVTYFFRHYEDSFHDVYFIGDPTVFKTYQHTIILPVGSIPGTWGLTEMTLLDKSQNQLQVDFTEIVRFEVTEETPFDLNADGEINILDLVIVANAIGESDSDADVNGDGTVNILDLVQIANHI